MSPRKFGKCANLCVVVPSHCSLWSSGCTRSKDGRVLGWYLGRQTTLLPWESLVWSRDQRIAGLPCTCSGFRPLWFFVCFCFILKIFFFFLMWTTFFQVFIEFVKILLLLFGRESCGILVPWPGIEPAPPALESKVFTFGLSEKSHMPLCFQHETPYLNAF